MNGTKRCLLVALDFSESSRSALRRAVRMIRDGDTSLLLVHVIDFAEVEEIARLVRLEPADLRDRVTRNRLGQVDLMLEELPEPVPAHRAEKFAVWGTPFAEILKKAREFDVDQIILGTAGRSADLETVLFGSTAEKVLRGASQPVLCVPVGCDK